MEGANQENVTSSMLGEELCELRSLGIDAKAKTEFNTREELHEFAEIIKQSLLVEYKLAYSGKGKMYGGEARATLYR